MCSQADDPTTYDRPTPQPPAIAEVYSGQRVWLRDFEAHVVEVMGADWPVVVLEKWETNELGERRFVDSRSRDFQASS